MRGVNKAIIVGNLGSDPEIRYTASGSAVANLSIATRESWTDKNTGQKQERTEWHRVTLFAKNAENAGKFLKKGSSVYVEGSIRTDKYQDKNTGQDRYSTSIIGNTIQFLGGSGQQSGQQRQQQTSQQTSGPSQDFEDSIPF